MPEEANIHSTGLVIAGTGILLRGPSGAGKSLLALEMLEKAERAGQKAVLVSDDRIETSVSRGKLIMQAPANIAGLIELRGRGIIKRPYVTRAEVHLVVDIVEEFVRLIEEDQLVTTLHGVKLPRCPVPNRSLIDSAHQQLLVREALNQLAPVKTARRKKTA